MAMYPKTTGDCITFRPKVSTAANGGRMKGDDLIKEMFNIMLPVAELKTMMSDEVDAWIAKMAEYGQEWCTPDGHLLKVSDYPELFALIGYKYGWSNTNPNGTYTYTFTDNNGNERSLIIYTDLDIDGNAKPVPKGESPLYFRLPNLSGRFLRCAGTASYVNKWTDTDGTVRQLLTEYKAEMYRGQLDAQRGITGNVTIAAAGDAYHWIGATGVFIPSEKLNDVHVAEAAKTPNNNISKGFKMNSSLQTPTDISNHPATVSMMQLLRIA